MTSAEPKFQQNKNVFEYDPANWAEEIDSYAPYVAAAVGEDIKRILSQTRNFHHLATDKKALEPQSTKTVQLSDREKPLLELVALMLATHLYEVYDHKLKTTLDKEGLDAIDTNLPNLRLDTDSDGERLTLELTYEDVHKIASQLQQPIEALFQGSSIWHKCYRSIQRYSFTWAMEAMEKDLGVAIPESEDEYESYTRTLFRYYSSDDNKSFESLYKLYSHEITRFLVREMDLPNRSLAELEALLGLRKQQKQKILPFVTAPPLFVQNCKEKIIAAAPSRTTVRSLIQFFNWQQNSYDSVFFTDNYSTGKIELFIKELDPTPQEYIRFTDKAAWGIVRQFEDFGKDVAKLHWILSAYAFLQSKPWETTFTLSGTYLIKLLGWERKDLSKAEKLNRLDHCLKLLRTLNATIKWDVGKLSCDGNYQIWQIDIKRYGERNLFTGNVDKPSELEVKVRAGNWTEFFFNKQGKKAKQALYEFGWLSESTLKFDSYHNELAFLIASHLTADSAINKSGRYTVRTLLEMALSPSAIESARSVKYKAQDLKDRWDEALEQMKMDWVIQFESETYPEWLQPKSQVQKPKGFRAKSIDVLLEAVIFITLRHDIQAQNARKDYYSKHPKHSPNAESALEWEPIQKACEANGWTKQSVIAKKLGISQSLVSQFQHGKPISAQTAAKLRKTLAQELPGLFVWRLDSQNS